MKKLITKSDGTPTKSKVHALQFLEKNGIPKESLIAENGQFYYETEEVKIETKTQEVQEVEPVKEIKTVKTVVKTAENEFIPVSWETEVYKGNEHTQLFIPGTDIVATIRGKYPAGQSRNKSAMEICIGDEAFIMSVDLLSRIFKVKA